ncbi:chalcone isomerase family protein [Shewanella marinintestina]|uniref:chalcone isomerase family protein n=1 Tax=Shewanella marinintestina TaxID=190305 RepID=UPI002010C397|nr:chalcone isomerase family protein [Shewanella marinintestina]MCL1145013.1 chalcone isomerase family protein [Shewanella marinintestina]
MRVTSFVRVVTLGAAKFMISVLAILFASTVSAEAKIVQQLIDESTHIVSSSSEGVDLQATSSQVGPSEEMSTTYKALSQYQPDDFKEVGRGEMQWWWFALYRAKLLTLDGDYKQGDSPLVLDIEYYQDIPSKRLVEATLDQWQHLGVSEQNQQKWLAAIKSIWPDVSEGDKLTLRVLGSGVSQFYFNGEPLSEPMPKGFSEDFLAIWLSESTSRPELRKQLLGELACDC